LEEIFKKKKNKKKEDPDKGAKVETCEKDS